MILNEENINLIDPEQPYPSQRAPVYADNIVATSQPLAVQAGLDVLKRGGNAVDAALAAAITLTIVEPTSNGIGSDAFAIVWDGSELTGLNGSGRAPALWTPDYFSGRRSMPQFGWDSVTVPGAVSVWVALSKRYGKIDFQSLFESGIRYADQGFQVGPVTARCWRQDAPLYAAEPAFRDHFSPVPEEHGQRVFRPDAAKTLRDIAMTEGASFYEGELAERIERAAIAGGGALRRTDLAEHKVDWVTPIPQSYREMTLHEIPPNGQGLAAQIALGILQQFDPPPVDSCDSVHLQIEVMKIALNAAAQHFADASAMQITPEALLDTGSLQRAAATIKRKAAVLPPVSLPVSHDTVYLAAADADGMMVSFIQSNYYGFGSGIVIPETGIAMQNRGWGFTLRPGHPNRVAPRKRPFHTIIPGFVTQDGKPKMSFGVMGGPMQAQGHVQMMVRIFDHGQTPQTASDAPRWHVYPDFSVGLEPGFSQAVARELAERGHALKWDTDPRTFGGAQIILREGGGYAAGSDHRKEGLACGF